MTVSKKRCTYINGKPQANVYDRDSTENLKPFGRCSKLDGVCIPAPSKAWSYGKKDVVIEGGYALMQSSILFCKNYGRISIVQDGQPKEKVEKDRAIKKQEIPPKTKNQEVAGPKNKEIKYVSIENPGGGRCKDKSEGKSENIVDIKGWCGTYQMDYRAAKAYNDMVEHARKDGFEQPLLSLTSGFRSDARQKELFDEEVNKYIKQGDSESKAKEKARKWVAPPGGSIHRTGKAVDMKISTKYPNSKGYVEKLKKTDVFKWLMRNAHKYGFYNYPAEPWHWEYNPPFPGIMH